MLSHAPGREQKVMLSGRRVDDLEAPPGPIHPSDQSLNDLREQLPDERVEQVNHRQVFGDVPFQDVGTHQFDIGARQSFAVSLDVRSGGRSQVLRELDPDHTLERIPASRLEDDPPLARPEIREDIVFAHLAPG